MLTLAVTACGKEEASSDTLEVSEETQAAEDNSKKEAKVVDEAKNESVSLDDYVGNYTNEDGEITITTDGSSYSMEVILYGLADLDEGTVAASDKGIIFDTIDPSGEAMKLSLVKADDSYTLKVEESTWSNLETGVVYEGFLRDNADVTLQTPSDLEDGTYYSNLNNEPAQYAEEYVTDFMLQSDYVAVDASFSKMDDEGINKLATLEKKVYNIPIDANTKFLAGGGEGEPQYMSDTEFNDYIDQCMGSGLGLSIIIENGVAVEIGIWS